MILPFYFFSYISVLFSYFSDFFFPSYFLSFNVSSYRLVSLFLDHGNILFKLFYQSLFLLSPF